MDLFKLVNHIFSNKTNEWKNIKRSDKAKNFFMINRFFSIQFPIQAQMINRNGIDGAAIVDMWKQVGSKFTKTPGWIFTKTKKVETKKETKKEYSKELIDLYLRVNKIGIDDFNLLIKYHPEEMDKYFERLEKILNKNEGTDES